MFNFFFHNLFNKKTIKKLEQTTRKFVASITILMSIFYGTLYYALITLASEDDKVPKPLVSQVGDSAGNPQKYYLESLENKADKTSGLTSESYDNYKEFVINGNKIVEPIPVVIKNKLYVPFRLLIASSSNDYEVEFKSKKGIQKISLAGDRFEYSIFEKHVDTLTNGARGANKKKGFLKLATVKPEFQIKHYESVEVPIPSLIIPVVSPSFDTPTPEPTLPPILESTPEPIQESTASPQSFWRGLVSEAQADEILLTSDWQSILFANPVSTSWTIYDNYIEIKQTDGFTLGSQNYDAWLKIKLGFDGSDYINFWDFGIYNHDGIESNLEFQVKFRADLAGKINRKANDGGDLETSIEKKEDDLATKVFDLEEEVDSKFVNVDQENEIVPEITPIEILQSSPTELISSTPTPLVLPISPEVIESPTVIPEPSPSPEPVITPHFDVTPMPIETPIPELIPEPNRSTDSGSSVPELIQAELSPTSFNETHPTMGIFAKMPIVNLHELLGVSIANAEEAVEQPAVEPQPIEAEPLSNNGSANEEPIPPLSPDTTASKADPIIEGVSDVINQITEGLTSFVESTSVSLTSLEPAADTSIVPITIFEKPITASADSMGSPQVDLSEPPQESQPLLAQIANVLSGLNVFSNAKTITSELNFGLGEEGSVNLQIDEAANTITTEISLKSELPADLVAQPLSNTATTDHITRTVLATLSNIGVQTDKTGIWVASGDGSKGTDFKIHFNPQYGGAIDQLYLGTDFATNKVAKPQAGSGGLTLLEQDKYSQAETRSSTLEVIEQSKVRIVIDNIFKLGKKVSVAERWSIYATGRIIKKTIYDKQEAGEERWYLNAAKSGFDLATGYNETQLIINTKLEPNSKDLMLIWQSPGSMVSSSFETGDTALQGASLQDARMPLVDKPDSWITVVKSTRQPWTYTEYQMIDLMQENLSMVDKTATDERANDYRNPDKPEFALGRFIQVNKQYQSYEMESAANQNRVIFTMDGSQTPRFQPVFEIHDWENPDLAAVKSSLNKKDMVENRDYIVDFRNGDSSTGILVFHFLGTIRVNSEFSADGFGVFDIDPEVAPGGGILVYGDGASTSFSTITTNATGNVMGAFASISASDNNPIWVVNRASPVGGSQASGSDNEHLIGNLNTTGSLEMLRWDGTSYIRDWTENNVGSQALDFRPVDIAYESGGEAVAAWVKTKNTTGDTLANDLEYRVWNGVSWGASTSFDLGNIATISWIEMASHPASGSNQNEIGLCYVTGYAPAGTGAPVTGTETMVGCAIWDGDTNTWGNTKLQESDAEESGTTTGSTKTVSVFYEQSSGQLVAVWGIEHAGNGTAVGIGTTTWDTATGWAATAGFAFGVNGDGSSTTVCSPQPTISAAIKNKAICANHHAAAQDTNATIWSGTALGQAPSTAAIDSNSGGNGALGRIGVATAWLVDGTNRFGLLVWSSNDGVDVDWIVFDDNLGTWGASQSLAHTTGADNTYGAVANPSRKDTAMFFLVDSNSDLFAYEASLSETTVTVACSNMSGGGPCSGNNNRITADLGTPNGLAVGLGYDLFPNPTQNHYQWLNDSGGLNSGTAAASQDTQLTNLAQSTIKRLRVEISNEGTATLSDNFQLEFAKKGTGCTEPTLSAGWRYREIHTTAVTASDAFDIELTANFANGDATTASLSAGDPNFVAGQGIESASSTSAITLNGNNYTEIEYALQANTNAQATTNYCFRITDGGSSTSYTYQKYAEVQTAAAATAPTYTQDFFRFYVNTNAITPTDPWPTGGNDLAENATMSAHFASVASGSITRVRTNVLVSTATLNAASQTFQFQYAEGFKCGAIVGGSWAAVGASTSDTIWRFGSNAGVTDGTTLASPVLLSNSTDADRATYEEGNPSAVNPNAVAATERMEHDWSLQNNGAVSGASYCFRIIRNSGTVFETYNRFPLVVLGPSTDQVLRHGAFFSEGYEQGYYWAGI